MVHNKRDCIRRGLSRSPQIFVRYCRIPGASIIVAVAIKLVVRPCDSEVLVRSSNHVMLVESVASVGWVNPILQTTGDAVHDRRFYRFVLRNGTVRDLRISHCAALCSRQSQRVRLSLRAGIDGPIRGHFRHEFVLRVNKKAKVVSPRHGQGRAICFFE